MAIEIYAFTDDQKNTVELTGADHESLRMLGGPESAIAFRLNEVLTAVQSSVSDSVTEETNVSIEISGKISLKAEGGIKYLLLNMSASAESEATMKITLSTKIKPKQTE